MFTFILCFGIIYHVNNNETHKVIIMEARTANIQQLRTSLNEKHNSQLTDAQVEHWIGSDTPTSDIKDLYYEVVNNTSSALSPEDVLDLWED